MKSGNGDANRNDRAIARTALNLVMPAWGALRLSCCLLLGLELIFPHQARAQAYCPNDTEIQVGDCDALQGDGERPAR